MLGLIENVMFVGPVFKNINVLSTVYCNFTGKFLHVSVMMCCNC